MRSPDIITRVEQLLTQRDWSKAQLARAIDESPQTLNGWFARRAIPSAKLTRVAAALGTTADHLLGPPPASKIAESRSLYNAGGGLPLRDGLPVLTWVQAGRPHTIDTDQRDNADHEQMLVNRKYPPGSYALRVRGDSMVAPDGTGFPDGSNIAIDPHAPPQHGDYVVARFAGSDEATFKQLVLDGPHRYLKPLNPNYPTIPVTADVQLCGVVCELVVHKRFR